MKNTIQEIFFEYNPWHEYDINDYKDITENVLSMNKEEVEQIDELKKTTIKSWLKQQKPIPEKKPGEERKAFNVRIKSGNYIFDLQTPTEVILDLEFSLPGNHNLTNALMAIAMAKKQTQFQD